MALRRAIFRFFGCGSGEKSALPAGGNINAEIPVRRCVRFATTNLPRLLVHRSVKGMTVNVKKGGGGERAAGERTDRLSSTQQVCRLNSGFLNCPAICQSVPAIYAFAREINEDVGIFQFSSDVQ